MKKTHINKSQGDNIKKANNPSGVGSYRFRCVKKIKFFTWLAILLFALPAFGQDWHVPEADKNMDNPSPYTLENVKKGKELYMKNCKSCHGEPGKNNGLPLVPLPPDVASEQMQKNTVGDLYYKITYGKGTMPQFESTVSADDRWRIINYIMNFNPGREKLLANLPAVKAKLLASVNEATKKVEVFAEYFDNGHFIKLPEASITISAQKVFGNLKLGESVTDANGRAEFLIPSTLIGDEEGYANIVIGLNDDYEADKVVLNKVKVGQKKQVPLLIKKGKIIWSTNKNTQLWLLLSYIASACAAWIAIIYVVYQIIKVKRLGKTDNS